MKAKKIWFDNDKLYAEMEDGRVLWQSILYYRRLVEATDEQKSSYELGHFGIHWEEIDEDVSYESFEYENPEPVGISRLFLTHPELNATAVARRMGMKQSLLAAYICGDKKPSKEREKEIVHTVKKIGKELLAVKI
jgi:hypothetical protein